MPQQTIDYTGNAIKADAFQSTSANLVSKTSSFTVNRIDHDGKVIVLNAAAGLTATMPAATGSGARYTFIVGTTITSNNYIISASAGSSVLFGVVLADDGDGEPANGFFTAASNNTITLGGTSNATGGVKGEIIEMIDFGAGAWHVRIFGQQGGTEATPFSTV